MVYVIIASIVIPRQAWHKVYEPHREESDI